MTDSTQVKVPNESANHLYDTPTACPTARQFLLDVMHDRATPLHIRIDAADKLLRIFGVHDFYPPWFTYQIKGFTTQ